MSELMPVRTQSRRERVWELTSDVLIATMLIWTLPVLLGVAMAVAHALTR